MIITRGLNQRNELVNDRFTALFGYTIDDIPDVAHWWRLAYPDKGYRQAIRTEWQQRVEKAISSDTDIEPLEATVRCKDGSFRHIEARLSCIGETSVVTLIDLTRRKQAEGETRENEKRYRRIVETTNEGVWLLDSNLHTAYVNRQMAEMLGCEPAEMVGRSVLDFYFPEDVEYKKQVLGRRQKGVREQIEERLRRSDGSELWVRMAADPIFRDNGEFDGAMAMVADITERRRAEEALRGSEERLRLATQAGRMYAYEWDVATDRVMRSEEHVNVLGFTEPAKQLTRQHLVTRVHPDDRELFISSVDKLTPLHPTTNISFRVLRPDGSIIWLEKSARAFFDDKNRILRVIGMVADITERKRADEALANVSRQLIEAQEQERTRIARELHDDIGQRLALLSTGLGQLQESSRDLPHDISSFIRRLHGESSQIASDVQSLSHELHSSKLEILGMAAAMKGYCREFCEQQRVEINCETDGLPGNLPPAITLCLFRVLQEALHNSTKHSGVRQFEVRSWATADEVRLTVRDSGSGFDVKEARNSRGLGLVSMEERLKLVKGTLSIESQPKRGTTIYARVPFQCG